MEEILIKLEDNLFGLESELTINYYYNIIDNINELLKINKNKKFRKISEKIIEKCQYYIKKEKVSDEFTEILFDYFDILKKSFEPNNNNFDFNKINFSEFNLEPLNKPNENKKTENSKNSKSKIHFDLNELIDNEFYLGLNENIEKIENLLIDIENQNYSDDTIDRLFRAFHSIKGESQIIKSALPDKLIENHIIVKMAELNHNAETVLEYIRQDKIKISNEFINTFFKVIDVNNHIIDILKKNSNENIDCTNIFNELNELKKKNNNNQEEEKTRINKNDYHKQIKKKFKSSIIKLDISKVDSITNKIKSLIIFKGKLQYLYNNMKENYKCKDLTKEVKKLYEEFSHISDELNNESKKIRMEPINSMFSRFPRAIRDLANCHNKKVKMIIKGGDTEIDRNILELVHDPLSHILRNCVDHGLGLPEERIKAGKSETGIIELSAFYEKNDVVIKITDDGKGLNTNKILNKALELGLVEKEKIKDFSDEEINNFILLPGFSTADKISETSGRGVGLDVVKNNLQELGGSLKIVSETGKGTTFILKAPLTMVNSKVLEIFSKTAVYLVLSSDIQEIITIKKEDIKEFKNKFIFNYRDEIIPLLDINKIFEKQKFSYQEINSVLILNTKKGRIGLKIEKTGYEREVEIKNNPEIIRHITLFKGSAIMPDGSVFLIIQPESLK